VILSDQNIVITAGVAIIPGVTILGEPHPLSKFPCTVVDPETFVSSSSRPCSSDLPQLTRATSTWVFLHLEYLLLDVVEWALCKAYSYRG
jgi:hypothetical protein